MIELSKSRMRTVELACSLLLVLLPLVVVGPALLPGHALLPANMLAQLKPWSESGALADTRPWNVLQFDGIGQFYPWRKLAADTWRSGYVPLWNPYQFCGTPLLANSQSAVLYPPNVIFVLFGTAYAFGVSAWAHLALTGCFLFAFLRRALRIDPVSALLGATAWQLGSWQISWLALPTFLCTSTWLPLTLLLLHRLRNQANARNAALLCASIALTLLGGHLQIAFYTLGCAVAYGVFLIPARQAHKASYVAFSAFAFALGFVTSMAQVLPVVEFSRWSHRSGEAATIDGFHAYCSTAMPWFHLATLSLPAFFGLPQHVAYWGATNFAENAVFLGTVPLILSLVAVTRRWKTQKNVRFFAIVATASLLVALGSPLAGVPYFLIPGFSSTGSPARILVLWSFCGAILAAAGLHALRRGACPRPAIWCYVAIAAGLPVAVVRWIMAAVPAMADNLSHSAADNGIAALLGVAAIAVVLAAHSAGRNKAAPAFAAVALTICSLVAVDVGYNPVVAQSQVYPRTALTDWLQAHVQTDRIMPINRDWQIDHATNVILPPNAATVYGLSDIQGYDSLQTRKYKEFANQLDGNRDSSPDANGNIVFTYAPGTTLSRSVAAKYVVMPSASAALGTPAFTDGVASVYIDPAAQPRARMAAGSPAEYTPVSPTRLTVTPPTSGTLIVANQFVPGWTASQDGRQLAITGAVPGQIDIVRAKLPVALTYQPDSLRVGLYLSLVGLCIIAGTALRRNGHSPKRSACR